MIDEALNYFNSEKGFQRLFFLFKKKYESLGRFGGTVKTDEFTDEELTGVAQFFGLTVNELRSKGKISLNQFERQLEQTKFANVDLKELLEAYYEEPLVSKKEKKRQIDEQRNQFILKMKDEFPELTFWLNYLQKKTPDTYWIYRLMDYSAEEFKQMISRLHQAFTQLPDDFERLPMFSQRITRDPHAFDLNTNTGRLFIHLLAVDQFGEDSVVVPTESEGINDLLINYQILRDDITNDVTCVNLLAESGHRMHPMWEAAAYTHSVMNIPLRELLKLKRIYPANEINDVWVVENSGVFSSILDQAPEIPFICTHGQFKLAALLLMDKLVEEGCTIHYAGDLDPEGIGMADRLLKRYPEHVQLWKMEPKDYHVSASDLELSQERLAKLDRMTATELKPVVEEIKKQKKAGYQEALVDEMVKELESKLK